MTSWVILFTLVEISPTILSTLPLAMSGMLKSGFFVRSNSPCVGDGLTTLSVYGPYPGGGLPVTFLNGDFAAGVGAACTSASAYRMRVSGLVSVTVIVPAASSALMPVMWPPFFFAVAYSSMPLIGKKNDENGPPRFIMRSIVFS